MISRLTELLKFRVGYPRRSGGSGVGGGWGKVMPSTGFSFCVSDYKTEYNNHSLILEEGYFILL